MSDPAGEVVRTGPRWTSVLDAVDAAVDAMGAPLDDEELAAGWTEELRGAILDDVTRVRDELATATATTVVLGDWSHVDELDGGEALRFGAVLDVDLVLGDLDRAEQALAASTALLGDLGRAIGPADRDAGFDEAVRDELVGLVESIRAPLAAGAYLTHRELDPWADALRALDFVRRSPAPGLYDDGALEGFTRQPLADFPRGARFERVALYDGTLLNVAVSDVLEEELAAAELDVDDPG
jgi:hypothetical protein